MCSEVLFEDVFSQTEKIREWFDEEEVSPKLILQTKQLSAILRMISENLAVGFLFRQCAENDRSLCAVPAKPALFVDIGIVWKKDAFSLSSIEKLKEFLFHRDPFSLKKLSSKELSFSLFDISLYRAKSRIIIKRGFILFALFYINCKSSSGVEIIASGEKAESVSLDRYPQSTATVKTPAFLPVSISTSVSPI